MNKRIRIKRAMFIICTLILAIGLAGCNKTVPITNSNKYDTNDYIETTDNNIKVRQYDNKKYYVIKDTSLKYSKDYSIDKLNGIAIENKFTDTMSYQETIVLNLNEYYEFCEYWGIDKLYNDSSQKYTVYRWIDNWATGMRAEIIDTSYTDDKIYLYIDSISADFKEEGQTIEDWTQGIIIVLPVNSNINYAEAKIAYDASFIDPIEYRYDPNYIDIIK